MMIVHGITGIATAGNSPADSTRRLVETTVSAAIADEIVAGARTRGHDVWSMQARCGVTAARHRAARITLTQCVSLMRATQLATRDAMLGFGRQPMPAGMFSAICHTIAHCQELRYAVDGLNQLYGVYLGGAPFRRDSGRITLATHSALQAKSPLLALCLLFSCYRILCWLSGRRLDLHEVGLAAESHPLQLVFADLFGCSLRIGTSSSYLAIAEYDLQSAVARGATGTPGFGDSTLMGFLKRALERRLEQRIRSVIGDDLSRGLPAFETVAKRLAMTPRDLSRRLERITVTFDEVEQRLRRDIALALLESTDCSFDDVALRAGFTRTAWFESEFRGWMGMSPAGYRRPRLHRGLPGAEADAADARERA